jgi:hypothetical protein
MGSAGVPRDHRGDAVAAAREWTSRGSAAHPPAAHRPVERWNASGETPGDALLLTDAIEHGSALRTSSGDRRVIIFSYTPGFCRDHADEASDELVARLTPERRQLVQPVAPIRRPRRVPGAGSR